MIKLHLRLGIHIFSIVFLLFTIITVMAITSFLFMEKGHTLLGLGKEKGDLIFVITFFTGVILSSIWYVWYLGKPLVYLMLWLRKLANDKYELPTLKMKSFYKKNGKLKRAYRLYQDVFKHMQKLTEVLQRNQKEQERLDMLKREWGAGISHDLKTPLTYITSYSMMYLSSQYSWSVHEKEDFVQLIQQKSMHLEELIEDLNLSFQMDYSEIPLNISTHNMVEFVRRIIVDIANDPRAREHMLEFELDQEHMDVSFDQKLFRRLLHNILMNAVLHNPPKTKIHTCIHLSDRLHITIKDNGVGMDKHTLENLFNKYHRAETPKQSSEGTGLGMAISKQLILAHNGSIKVISREGEGTSIYISLPIKQQ